MTRKPGSVVHGLAAWAGLASAVLFLIANIKSTEDNAGYIYLLLALLCGTVVMLARRRSLGTITVPRSTVFLLAFLVYFLTKMLIDFRDVEQMKSFALGTTHGLLFGYLFGGLTSLFASTLFLRNRSDSRGLLPVFLFLAVSAFLAADALVAQLSMVRTDFFLVDSDIRNYQRRGNFVIMIVLIGSVVLTQTNVRTSYGGFARTMVSVGSFISYMVLVATLLLVAQVVGSNTGFVVSLALLACTLAWSWRPKSNLGLHWAFSPCRVGPFRLLRRALPRLSANILLITAGLVAVGVVGLVLTDLTLEQFRIVGFSERTLGAGSLASRIEILTTNFVDQFAVDPVFGNLRAEYVSGGAGTYAHSLVSLLSHLGIVGALIFTAFIFAVLRELGRTSRLNSYSRDADLAAFKIMSLAAIIGFALIGTFFTWMPLWFSLGFLHPPLIIDSSPLSTSIRAEPVPQRMKDSLMIGKGAK